MDERARDRVVTWALAAAVALQGLNLILMGRLELRAAVQVAVVTAALALVVGAAWHHRLRLNHRVDMLLVMAAFGGLGMLLGWWADLGFVAPPVDADLHTAMGHGPACPHHGGGGGFWAMVGSWMTAGMLLGAIPPALLVTRCAELARTSWRRFLSTHLVGNALMVAAMIWVGHWLGPGLARAMGGSAVLGGHTGMMLGMLLGMEAGMFAGEAALGLQPWREWTWRAQAGADLTGAGAGAGLKPGA